MILYGCGTSTTHNANNYPIVLAGGAKCGFNHGQCISLSLTDSIREFTKEFIGLSLRNAFPCHRQYDRSEDGTRMDKLGLQRKKDNGEINQFADSELTETILPLILSDSFQFDKAETTVTNFSTETTYPPKPLRQLRVSGVHIAKELDIFKL